MHHKRYGSPQSHDELVKQQEQVSGKRVVRQMQAKGLAARLKRRTTETTDSNHKEPVALNLLDRQFNLAELNKV